MQNFAQAQNSNRKPAFICGIPSGLEAFKAAHEVLVAEGAIANKDGA